MLTITTNSFENDVLRADKPVLVDFWAQWCPYCRRIAPAFDKVGVADTLITMNLLTSRELVSVRHQHPSPRWSCSSGTAGARPLLLLRLQGVAIEHYQNAGAVGHDCR